MIAHVEERSRITAKGQTTVPKAVRQALGVGQGDEIAFRMDEHGVSVRRVDAGESDPVIDRFLHFLAQDIARNPGNLAGFPPALARRMAELTDGIGIPSDEAIDGPVDI